MICHDGMDDIKALAAHHDDGGTISFGPRVALVAGTLRLPGESMALNTVGRLHRDADGNVLVGILGSAEPPILVLATEVEDVDRFVQVTNRFVRAIPYLQRRSATGWPPGSIGDISVRIGTDVRDLLIVGYTLRQIEGVLCGEYSLAELYKKWPRGKPMTLHGKRS